MRILLILFFTGLFVLGMKLSFAETQDSNNEDSILLGIDGYNRQDYSKAKSMFEVSLSQNPRNSDILINLGLAEYKLGNKGQAIGYWRRAIFLNPGDKSAISALEFALKEIGQRKDFLDQTLFEVIHRSLLSKISIHFFFAFFIFFVILSGISFIKDLKRRYKLAHQVEDNRLIRFVKVQTWILSILLILSLTATLVKIFDLTIPRSTVVKNEVNVRSGPGTERVALFSLLEGQTVKVSDSTENWVKIVAPKNKIGWVEKDTLYQTSGIELW